MKHMSAVTVVRGVCCLPRNFHSAAGRIRAVVTRTARAAICLTG